MNIFSVAMFGLVAAILALTLKKYSPETSLAITIGAGVLIFGYILLTLLPVIRQVLAVAQLSEQVSQGIQVLLKALGICYITQLAADTCKDAGQQAIATKVELAGKVAVLAIAMPMLGTIAGLMDDLIF
ncbi:SpoIIIAC/SpoIIIAD family protein [Neobittarella massiliensis]|uniref:Stage III sporulation protein AD n=2 Tax=Oscillospiraceae TaxID=216572 RepID=A0A8J6INB9_9FIRM|nr:SpoIIIAC/SpoIIIAD family protein [Neobittarella massiliensis]MBC3515737.1 stage III sporulation protein AD [Neobittarella massiliensis]SCJ47742.1 stage III sporulation protein AD [uncultured Anaerotruncus sp.]